MNRYVVVSRACAAPKSRGGRYRRPVRIVVVDADVQNPNKPITKGIVAEWRNVDSRYSGQKSEHGQALIKANELAKEMNKEVRNIFDF